MFSLLSLPSVPWSIIASQCSLSILYPFILLASNLSVDHLLHFLFFTLVYASNTPCSSVLPFSMCWTKPAALHSMMHGSFFHFCLPFLGQVFHLFPFILVLFPLCFWKQSFYSKHFRFLVDQPLYFHYLLTH